MVYEPRGLVRRRQKPYTDIWRQPYSEKELRSSGFELAWADGEKQHMRRYMVYEPRGLVRRRAETVYRHMAAAIQRKGAAKQRI